MIDISRDEIFQKNRRVRSPWPEKEGRNFGRVESRTSWVETKKIHIKLAMTCNMNVQQDTKNKGSIVDHTDEDNLDDLWKDH